MDFFAVSLVDIESRNDGGAPGWIPLLRVLL